MATITQKFGERVKELRKKQGLTQEKLSEMINVDYSYLNQIEAGKKNPSLKLIARLARKLHISLPEFFSFKK